METKSIWLVSFGNNDLDDLNCAFDNFEKAKEAVQTIFNKISAANPAWQNLEIEDEDAGNKWAVYTFDYIGEDTQYFGDSRLTIVVAPIPYNSLPVI